MQSNTNTENENVLAVQSKGSVILNDYLLQNYCESEDMKNFTF